MTILYQACFPLICTTFYFIVGLSEPISDILWQSSARLVYSITITPSLPRTTRPKRKTNQILLPGLHFYVVYVVSVVVLTWNNHTLFSTGPFILFSQLGCAVESL